MHQVENYQDFLYELTGFFHKICNLIPPYNWTQKSKLTLAEITSFSWKFKLRQVNYFTGNFFNYLNTFT